MSPNINGMKNLPLFIREDDNAITFPGKREKAMMDNAVPIMGEVK